MLASALTVVAAVYLLPVSELTDQLAWLIVAGEPTSSHVVIRVGDNGRGIASDQLSVIFDMFQKGNGDGTGLGIGLAACQLRPGAVRLRHHR